MKRNIIEIDESLCVGCGQCVTGCAAGALKIENGKAKLVSEQYCDGLGRCIGHCPTGALKIIEKEVAAPAPKAETSIPDKKACACQSSAPKETFGPRKNWPIQLMLSPMQAPYFDQADLVIAADCVAFSHPNFHSEILQNKVLLIACPKLDDAEYYIEKLENIFSANTIRSVTVVRMSVPCCAGLTSVVKTALQQSGASLSLIETIIPV